MISTQQAIMPDTLGSGVIETFEPPLDKGIERAVLILRGKGIETFASCEGGDGHAYHVPTVRFEGGQSEGYRALAIALQHALPVTDLKRRWDVIDGELTGPYWELMFVKQEEVSGERAGM